MLRNNAQYYEAQQCSVQWRAFLAAFSAEFAAKGSVNDLRTFMHSLGRGMAQSLPLADGSNLQSLEGSINAIWQQINWGWVELVEEADCLLLAHRASPLKLAFTAASLTWTPALLEGVYAQWFENLGMDKSLRLTQKGEPLEDGQLFIYELKKQVEESSYFTRR